MHPTASLTPSRGGVADSAAPQPAARGEVAAIHLTFTRDLPLSQSALEFAVQRHAGQTRRADRADFVLHPVEVGSILERSHYPDYVVAAGILHDVIEDTDAERRDIEARFGPAVAELVATLSDDPSIGDEDRRREDLRARVRRAGGYASAIFAADKVSKVRELRALLASGPPTEETEGKLRHYWASLEMLEEVMPGSPLVELLRFELEAWSRFRPGRTVTLATHQIPADRNQRRRQVLEQPTESELRMRLIRDEGAVDRSEREPRQMVRVRALRVEPEDQLHLDPKPVQRKLAHAVDYSMDLALAGMNRLRGHHDEDAEKVRRLAGQSGAGPGRGRRRGSRLAPADRLTTGARRTECCFA